MAFMTDAFATPPSDQHDTAVLTRPGHGQAPGGSPLLPGHPSGGWATGGATAEQWAARYRRERTRARILLATTLLATLAAVGLGVAAWQFAQANPLVTAASDLASGLGLDLGGQDDSPSVGGDDGQSEETLPDASGGEAPPLPEGLQELGAALGIDDVGDLIDLGVANGLISQEQADQLRDVLEAASALAGDGSQAS